MNLQEAKANIGKEVVLDESTKPYTYATNFTRLVAEIVDKIEIGNYALVDVDLDGDAFIRCEDTDFSVYINPRHLKLKEQPTNYKIKVTPETSKEVQELFFELGFDWCGRGKEIKYRDMKFLFTDDKYQIRYDNFLECFWQDKGQEITLPQLRDMVVLKRNDVNDATHVGTSGWKYYIGFKQYALHAKAGGKWVETSIDDISQVTPIKKELQMTWEDAKQAIKEGKDVQVFVCEWSDIDNVFKDHEFRLKPKTVTLEARPYTKEELLKIAGEME